MAPEDVRLTRIAQDEVLTGEAVAVDVQPAGVLLRALGGIIDLILAAALLIAALVWGGGALAQAVGPDAERMVTIAVIVLVLVILPVAVETLSRGRSLGRLAVGARIVRADGGSSGFRQAFIRALVGVLEIFMTLGVVAVVTAMFTPRGQRLGDLVAGTYAQRTRAPAMPAALPPVPEPLRAWAATADVARLPEHVARRLAQFLRQQGGLQPAARERLGRELLRDIEPFVSPMPEADPVSALTAISAVRRERDLRALEARAGRVARRAGVLGPGEGLGSAAG